MVDYLTQLVTNLSSILPTYYELACDSSTEKPCITYQEYNNYSTLEGDTLRFSTVSYMIKIWDYSIADIMETAVEIDKVMKGLGFRRISSSELFYDTQICKLLLYEATGIETYSIGG